MVTASRPWAWLASATISCAPALEKPINGVSVAYILRRQISRNGQMILSVIVGVVDVAVVRLCAWVNARRVPSELA